jgi:plastocyanin
MKSKALLLAAVTVGVIVGVLAPKLVHLAPAASASNNCATHSSTSQSHTIMIMGGHAEPQTVAANLCDTITITNMDSQAREIAFGPHENHIAYDGILEKVLNANQSLTITLVQAGSFHFHDHLDDSSQGSFTVTK